MHALSDPRLRRATILLAALAVGGSASADSIQYDFTKTSTMTGWSDQKTLNKFDPTLGTLTSVDFFLGGNMSTTTTMTLDQGNTSTVMNVTTGSYSIQNLGMTMPYFYSKSEAYSVSRTLSAGQTYTDPSPVSFASLTAANSAASHYTDASTLASFLGPGTVNLFFVAKAVSDTSTNSNAHGGNRTFADGTGYVRYNYTANATPEPASFGALAIGAVALMRRRKKAVVR